MDVFEIFRQLAHESRLRIINLLDEHELCVCELEEILKIKQVNISKHINKLKKAGIVSSRRDKQRVFYFLSKAFLEQKAYLEILRENRHKHAILSKDNQRFISHENSKDDKIYVCNVFKKERLT